MIITDEERESLEQLIESVFNPNEDHWDSGPLNYGQICSASQAEAIRKMLGNA